MTRLIINRPELQSQRQRFTYSVLTFLFWMVWIYIWLPVISLIAWGFGVQLFYDEMILQNGLDAFVEQSTNYGLSILLLTSSLLIWAIYNWRRFRNKERRSGAKPLTIDDQADYFELNAQDLAGWKKQKKLVVQFDEQGKIVGVQNNSITSSD